MAAEIRESVIPVIGQFAHAGLLAKGHLLEPAQYAAEWEIFFAHLLAGTNPRLPFGQVLKDPSTVRVLVDEALVGHSGATPTMAEVGILQSSWSALSTIPFFGMAEVEDDGELSDGYISPGLPILEETQGAQGAALFSGTRGDVRDQEPPPPMQSWLQQPPAPAPLSGRSGCHAPALVDDYQMFDDDDPEEY